MDENNASIPVPNDNQVLPEPERDRCQEAQLTTAQYHVDNLTKVNEIILEQIKNLYWINQKSAESAVTTHHIILGISSAFFIICIWLAWELNDNTVKAIIIIGGALGSLLAIASIIRKDPLNASRIALDEIIQTSTIFLSYFHQVLQIDSTLNQLLLSTPQDNLAEINEMLSHMRKVTESTILELEQLRDESRD